MSCSWSIVDESVWYSAVKHKLACGLKTTSATEMLIGWSGCTWAGAGFTKFATCKLQFPTWDLMLLLILSRNGGGLWISLGIVASCGFATSCSSRDIRWPKKHFCSNHWKRSCKMMKTFFWVSQTPWNDSLLSEFDPFSPITFGQSWRAVWMNYFIPFMCANKRSARFGQRRSRLTSMLSTRRTLASMLSGPKNAEVQESQRRLFFFCSMLLFLSQCAQWGTLIGMNGSHLWTWYPVLLDTNMILTHFTSLNNRLTCNPWMCVWVSCWTAVCICEPWGGESWWTVQMGRLS